MSYNDSMFEYYYNNSSSVLPKAVDEIIRNLFPKYSVLEIVNILKMTHPLVKISHHRVRAVLSRAKRDEIGDLMKLPGFYDDNFKILNQGFDRIMEKYADLHS